MHTRATAQTGAVTLIQRFGSALNLNLHFHMFFLHGIYVEDGHGKLRFHWVKSPNVEELKALVHAISHRVAGFLERRGVLERDADNSYLALESSGNAAMMQLLGCSITYRIALGSQQGQSNSLCKHCGDS